MKKWNPTPRKNDWLYICGGILAVVAAILFLPVWAKTDLPWASWGMRIVNLIIAACLMVYVANYLFPKVKRGGSGPTYMLVLIEFAVLCMIAFGCVLSQFQILNISGACVILGFCMAARGVVEIFRAYYHQADSKTKYPVWWLAVAIAFVIFGTYLVVKPLFTDTLLLWVFVLALFAYGLLLLAFGVACRQAKKAAKTKKEEAKKAEAEKKPAELPAEKDAK